MKGNIKKTFPVTGMSCAACASRVEKILNGQDGVENAHVNYAAATVLVELNGQSCPIEKLRSAVQKAGYDLLIDEDEEQAEHIRLAHYKDTKNARYGLHCYAFPFSFWECLKCSLM